MRSLHTMAPLDASRHVTVPLLLNRYNNPSTRIGEGSVGNSGPSNFHAVCESVTSPWPSTRIAARRALPRPETIYASPFPYTGHAAGVKPSNRVDQSSFPVSGSYANAQVEPGLMSCAFPPASMTMGVEYPFLKSPSRMSFPCSS